MTEEIVLIELKKTTAMRLALFMEENRISDVNIAIEDLLHIYTEEIEDD